MVIDFRRTKRSEHSTLYIDGEEVERVESFKFLGVHISADLTWSTNISHQVGKAQQRLYFLRKLRQAQLPQRLLVNFYRSTIESLLTYCCTLWFNCCTAEDKRKLQRVVRAAERAIGTSLTPLRDIYTGRLQQKASITIKDPSHPGHSLFPPFPLVNATGPSGQRQTDSTEVFTHRLSNMPYLHPDWRITALPTLMDITPYL